MGVGAYSQEESVSAVLWTLPIPCMVPKKLVGIVMISLNCYSSSSTGG
jgi:hypothetical protein